MEKGQFDYIYRNLSKKEKEILKWHLSDKNMTQKKIANLTNYDQGNISKKLRAIAHKFNYSESSLYWKEYLVNIFSKFQPDMVDQEFLKHYSCHQVFMPDGPEKLDSPFYIERHRIKRCSVEHECYEEIEKPSSLVRIKAPNQMGKTSLIKRIQDKANHSNYIPIYLRFDTLIESQNIRSINDFLKAFNKNIKSQFTDVPEGLLWDDNNAQISCTQEFEALLFHLGKEVVLLLDKVDELYNHSEITKYFCGMLRSWYEESKTLEIWENLRMVIAYSTEYHGTLDLYRSPFNVGKEIKLKEFEKKEVELLISLHQLDSKIVTDLMSMVGGHPYLIRLALYKMSQEELTIENLLKEAPTDSGIYRHHFSRHLETIEKRAKIKAVFKEILKANSPLRLPDKNREVCQLEGMGLITMKGDYAQPRCQLYRQYFQERLG